MWHPDGVRMVMGNNKSILPMWHPDGVRMVMGEKQIHPTMWHPDGVRTVMGETKPSKQVAPRWGADGYVRDAIWIL